MHLVMFDIDGTLIDSNGFDGDLYAQALREVLRIEVDRTWQSYRHVTDSGILKEVLNQFAPGIDTESVVSIVKNRFVWLVSEFLSRPGAELQAIPGACELVRRLRSTDQVVLAIATGGWKETAELKLAKAGFDIHQIPLATSSEAEARIDIMKLAEQKAGPSGQFRRKTYFGDALWDLRASAELGYSFVGVGVNVEHPVRFKDLTDHDAILSILGV